MRTFRDSAGKLWTVKITVAAVQRVRAIADIDLLNLKDGGVIEKLSSDPITLNAVLYAVCKPEIEAAGMTDEQFGELLSGDVIADATNATIEALIDFFPNETRRKMIRRAMDKMREAEGIVLRKVEEKADQVIQEAFAKILNQPFTDSPESSA